MRDIKNLLLENPDLAKNITIQVKGDDLFSFADKLVKQTAKEVERRITAEKMPEKLLTREETAEMLGISPTTLWRKQKEAILNPVKIGAKVLYRLSDIKKVIDYGVQNGK